MEIAGYVFLTATVTVFIYGALAYNRFVMLKHNVRKAWGNIDVLLKQRHDELPKLVATCKEYMKHEQDTLRKVVEARSMVAAAREGTDIPALGAAEKLLRSGLGQLFALVENYPDLKANETFHQLQSRITGLEHDIADRHEFYNDAVNVNNVGIEQFPDLFIAKVFDFRTHEVLLFEAAEKTDVDLRFLFQTPLVNRDVWPVVARSRPRLDFGKLRGLARGCMVRASARGSISVAWGDCDR